MNATTFSTTSVTEAPPVLVWRLMIYLVWKHKYYSHYSCYRIESGLLRIGKVYRLSNKLDQFICLCLQ